MFEPVFFIGSGVEGVHNALEVDECQEEEGNEESYFL